MTGTCADLGATIARRASALAVPSIPHFGQFTPTGIKPFTGVTSKP
ncbi:MAG TPA: hypothetical protein VGH19_03940 [Verrucomicrobiae bacterium]